VSSRARGVPYVAAGASVHHARFDLGDARFFGSRNVPFGPGAQVCAGPGFGFGAGPAPWSGGGPANCPANAAGYIGAGEMPPFYAMRLGPLDVPMNARWGRHSFTDPALSVGGGVRFNVAERLMIRPDFRALVLFGDGETHTLGVFVVNVGYRF
jgi:hypothetical protein